MNESLFSTTLNAQRISAQSETSFRKTSWIDLWEETTTGEGSVGDVDVEDDGMDAGDVEDDAEMGGVDANVDPGREFLGTLEEMIYCSEGTGYRSWCFLGLASSPYVTSPVSLFCP